MAIILSYIFYFVASTASSLQRRWLIKDKEFTTAEQIRFTFQCIFILFLGSLTFPLFSKFYLSDNYLYLFFLAVTCAVFGASGNILAYIGQKQLDAGTMSIVWNIYTPVTIFLSSVLIHERLTPLQIIGTIILLVAIVIISKKHHQGKLRFNKQFLYVLLGGILIGFLLVAERTLQKTTGFSAGIMISWGSQALGLGVASLVAGGRKHTYTKHEVLTTGFLQFLGATSYVMLVWVVGNLSVVASVTTFKVVIVVLAAAFLLGEKEDLPRKIFGSILAVIGLLLM